MANADVCGEFALKAIHMRAERRDPVGLECILDKGGFLVAQMRRRQPDPLREFATKHQIDRASCAIDHGNVIDLVGIHQAQNRRGWRIFADRECDLFGEG
jgi:hypothetical protein